MKLEQWSLVVRDYNPYQPPECQEFGLHGKVFGSKKFPDGVKITTTRPVKVFGSHVETASGSIYQLGSVDPAYEAAYPNARERLVQSVQAQSIEAKP